MIPDSVTSIGSYAFSWCTSLTSITVDENNACYKSVDGTLYSKDGKTLIQYAVGKPETSFVIPEGVTSIEAFAFAWCYHLTSVEIPDSVTSIEGSAFAGCDNLARATFKNPNGWEIFETSISSSILANARVAATYLIDTYSLYDWNRR